MPDKITSPQDLLLDKLAVLYASLQKISSDIGQFMSFVTNPDLSNSMQTFQQQTQQQVSQLEQMASSMSYSLEKGATDTVDALLKELKTLTGKREGSVNIDPGIIIGLQTLISYQLYNYSFVSNLASALQANPNIVTTTKNAFTQLESFNQQLTSTFQNQLDQIKNTQTTPPPAFGSSTSPVAQQQTATQPQPQIQDLKSQIDQQKKQLDQLSKQPPQMQSQQLDQLARQVNQQQQKLNQINQSPQNPQKLEQDQKQLQEQLKQQEQQLQKSSSGGGLKAKAKDLLSKIGS
jgi:ferritin-like metal-binding protein YciE